MTPTQLSKDDLETVKLLNQIENSIEINNIIYNSFKTNSNERKLQVKVL